MQRIGNLNGENITYDHDISGLMRGLIDGGVIEGGTVVGNKLQPVQAIVPLVRSNGQKILAFFESDEVIDLPTTGDYKVYIEVDQSKIDFGALNNEDGTGIAEIKTGPTLPSQNFLLLASVEGGAIKDERSLIPKIQNIDYELKKTKTTLANYEQQLVDIKNNDADYLPKRAILGEFLGVGDSYWAEGASSYIEGKHIRIDKWYAGQNENGNLQYVQSIILYDESGNKIEDSNYVNKPSYINRPLSGNAGSVYNNSTISFQKKQKVSKMEIHMYSLNASYYPNFIPKISVSDDNQNWGNVLGLQKIPLGQTQNPITILTKGVGEIEYTEEEKKEIILSEEVFVQKGFDFSECQLPVPIGDVDANKEIHIQRIANGTSFNELEFFLKKVGLPTTNLICEIKKGKTELKKTDGNGKPKKNEKGFELGWYGDGEVIASGQIEYEKISDNFTLQKIVLDRLVEVEAGELINIVLKQSNGIVNSGNYFIVGSAENTYSESLCFWAINGEQRVKNKQIVFCKSIGFVETFFAKNSSEEIIINGKNEVLYTKNDSLTNGQSFEFIPSKVGKFILTGKFAVSVTSYTRFCGRVVVYLDGIKVAQTQDYYSQSYTDGYQKDFGLQFTVRSKSTIKVVVEPGQDGYNGSGSNFSFLFSGFVLAKKGDTFPIRIYRGMGKILEATAFGFHKGEWIERSIGTEIKNSCITGNINLGPAVGFVDVTIKGKKYLMPLFGQ